MDLLLCDEAYADVIYMQLAIHFGTNNFSRNFMIIEK